MSKDSNKTTNFNFSMDGKYETRLGNQVRFYVFMEDEKEIHGACKIDNSWIMCSWNSISGQCSQGSVHDLREIRHIGYINLYVDCVGSMSTDKEVFRSTEDADKRARKDRVGRVRVEYQLGQLDL